LKMNRIERLRRNKLVKEALLSQIKAAGLDETEIVEWLWEDFGKRVKPEWSRIEKAILGDNAITSQDLAVFMIENDLQPDEGAWNVMPRRSLRGNIKD
jgi:hypothetical protein